MTTITLPHGGVSVVGGSPSNSLTVGVLDEETEVVDGLQESLRSMGFASMGTRLPEAALEMIERAEIRVLMSGTELPGMDGYQLLGQALERDPGIYVILMAESYAVEFAVAAIKRGAYDYIAKPLDTLRLTHCLNELANSFELRRGIWNLEAQILSNVEFHGLVGKSPAMLEVFEMVRKVARHRTGILLVGGPGTEKELVAKAIHEMSSLTQQRFAMCNCSGAEDSRLEGQLFGHIQGAFPEGTDSCPGLFESADGGTVLLDEVELCSPAIQEKLLRVIQTGEVQRVGATEIRRVNVRIIAATGSDLRAEVIAGRFREDLFYHLSQIQIRVPNLAEREDDIPLLTRYFLKKCNALYSTQVRGLTPRAQALMLQHSWPGNIRELETVIISAAVKTRYPFVDVHDLSVNVQNPSGRHHGGVPDSWRPSPLNEVRRLHIQRVLESCGGNRVRAAQLLGIGRTSLYRFLKRNERTSVTSPAG